MPEENKETIQAALDKATRLNTMFKIATTSVGAGFSVAMCSGYLLSIVPPAAALYLGYKWVGANNIEQLPLAGCRVLYLAGVTVGVTLAHGVGVNDTIELIVNTTNEEGAYVQTAPARPEINTAEIIVPKLAA
jgi:hypothetical protein